MNWVNVDHARKLQMKRRFAGRYVASFLVLAVLVAAGVVLHTSQRRTGASETKALADVPNRHSGQSVATVLTPEQIGSASISHPASNGPGVATSTPSGMLAAFNAMRSGRAFAIDAWQRPTAGGQFYASRLVDFCASVWQSTEIMQTPSAQFDATQSPVEQERKRIAFDAIKTRCADFVTDDFDSMSGRRAMASNSDPLVAAIRKMGDGGVANPSQRSEAIQALLEAADPLTLDDVGSRLTFHRTENGVPTFWFSGQPYPARTSPELLAAFYLVPCDFGLRCDATDPNIQLGCVTGGECYASRYDRALREYAGGDATKLAEITRWQQLISTAIRTKDIAAFAGPK